MKKQDRQGVRTPAALERKYDFTEQAVKINNLESQLLNVDILMAGYLKVEDLENGSTVISGDCIRTGSIVSSNFALDDSGMSIVSGMSIDLSFGVIDTPNFRVSSDGRIYSTSGDIAGFEITDDGFYKKYETDAVSQSMTISPSRILAQYHFKTTDFSCATLIEAGEMRLVRNHPGNGFNGDILTYVENGDAYTLSIDPVSLSVVVTKVN